MNCKHFLFKLTYVFLISAGWTLGLMGNDVRSLKNEELKSADAFDIVIKELPPKKLKKTEAWILGHLHVQKTDKKTKPHQILKISMNRKVSNFAEYGVRRPDFNSDGYPDIEILQHEGAKWGYVHLWLYDPKTDKFYTNEVTRRFSKIEQASYRVDPKTKHIHVKRFQGAELVESIFLLEENSLKNITR